MQRPSTYVLCKTREELAAVFREWGVDADAIFARVDANHAERATDDD